MICIEFIVDKVVYQVHSCGRYSRRPSMPPALLVRQALTIGCYTVIKLKRAIAILQLVYSSFMAYMQYEPLVKCQGLHRPFLQQFAYLYMSCVNLMGNFVQGSYMQVTVIPPAGPVDNAVRPIFSHPLYTLSPQTGAIRPPPRALLLEPSHRSDSILPPSSSAEGDGRQTTQCSTTLISKPTSMHPGGRAARPCQGT